MATIELPPARGHLPVGTSQQECINYSRKVKATAIAARLHLDGVTAQRVTAARMVRAAQDANVNPPTSRATRTMVRSLMRALEDVGTSSTPKKRVTA